VINFLLAAVIQTFVLVFYELDRAIPMNVGAYWGIIIAAASKYGIFSGDQKFCHSYRT